MPLPKPKPMTGAERERKRKARRIAEAKIVDRMILTLIDRVLKSREIEVAHANAREIKKYFPRDVIL